MLGPQDVGCRVVVRRVIGRRGERPLYSDALGELVELTATHLTIATERGPLRVPLAEVARAKRVPPRAGPRAAAMAALERAANEAWPAPDQARLGDWLLRAAGGWTSRGNSALPIGDPGRPLGDAVEAVRQWYAERGLPPRVNVPMPLAAAVNAALDASGWQTSPPVLVQTAPLAGLVAPTREGLPPVRLAGSPSQAWLDVVARRKGELPAAARHLLTAVREVRFAEVYSDSGEILALARGTVTGGRYFGIFQLEVVPVARRRGLARHVIGALAQWAGDCGATTAFLQVEEHNEAALALYEKLGFTTHHRYLTRTAPAP